MTRPRNQPRATRRGDHLKSVRTSLLQWRITAIKRYRPQPFTAVVLLPDNILTKLASNARLFTLEDLQQEIKPPWVWASIHGEEVLQLLKRHDDNLMAERETVKRAKQAEDAREKERIRMEKERGRLEKQRLKAEQRAAKEAERRIQRAQRDQLRPLQTMPVNLPRTPSLQYDPDTSPSRPRGPRPRPRPLYAPRASGVPGTSSPVWHI